MPIKIGHATKNEHNKAYGGTAGDQTGKEVCTLKWYKGGWHTVLRPTRSPVAEGSALACEDACANKHIGYNASVKCRNTLFKKAQLSNFDLARVTEDCECDCSSLMHTCAVAGGATIYYGSNAVSTSNIVETFVSSGEYVALTDSKYLTADTHLKRGDILVKTGHVVMVLENGSGTKETPKTIILELPELKKGSAGAQVATLQRILSTYGYHLGNNNPFDGKFGALTEKAVRAFQEDRGLTTNGIVGAETWAALLGIT